jgi:hypothetical protein
VHQVSPRRVNKPHDVLLASAGLREVSEEALPSYWDWVAENSFHLELVSKLFKLLLSMVYYGVS